MEAEFLKPAESFVQFLRKGVSNFHVVKQCHERLASCGFQRLSEKTNWSESVKPLGKYFITRLTLTIFVKARSKSNALIVRAILAMTLYKIII